MERGEYVPFRDALADICSDIAAKAIAGGSGGDEHVWIPPWPMKDHTRSTQVAVEHLIACGALEIVRYTSAEAWQCQAFRSIRQTTRGMNCFYVVKDLPAIRRWATEKPALTQRSARGYLAQSRAAA